MGWHALFVLLTQDIDFDPMNRVETLELVRAYYKIHNRKIARCFFDLIMALAKPTDSEDENSDGEDSEA